MTLKDDLQTYVHKAFAEQWTTPDGTAVPDTPDITLANDAVKLEGVVLYADLAESTQLVDNHDPRFAAEIYKTYLYCAARLIRWCGGTITAYDGDRVMAVFLGGRKNTNAAKCGLRINWAVNEVINPAAKAQYGTTTYQLTQKVGVDSSSLFVARTGIRGSNDLVWVGRAANYAAKLAALTTAYTTYISADVYNIMLDETKIGGNPPKNMWTDLSVTSLGIRVFGSNWQWSL